MAKVFSLYCGSVIVAVAAAIAGRAIKFDGTLPAAGDRVQGVARSDGAVGTRVPVDQLGLTECEAGAAFVKGAELQIDALGRFVTKTTGAKVGVAEESATAAGQKVSVWVQQF
jgi:hypothetical protein